MNSRETESPEPPSGPPPPERARLSDVAMVEIAKLQNDGDHIKVAVKELRGDSREMRDRLTTLEAEVRHLPSKGFIITVVVVALTISGGFLTLLPKVQQAVNSSSPAASQID